MGTKTHFIMTIGLETNYSLSRSVIQKLNSLLQNLRFAQLMPHPGNIDKVNGKVVLFVSTLANINDIAVTHVLLAGDEHESHVRLGLSNLFRCDSPNAIIPSV